jgi:hypothetical protein
LPQNRCIWLISKVLISESAPEKQRGVMTQAKLKNSSGESSAMAVWRGFEPTGYQLRWGHVRDVELEIVGGPRMTVGELIGELLPRHWPHEARRKVEPRNWVVDSSGVGRVVFRSPSREIAVNTLGNRTKSAVDIVAALVEASNAAAANDVDFSPVFFWFDGVGYPDQESANFFVVNGERIILENLEIDCRPVDGFNPACFAPAFDTGSARLRSIASARLRLQYQTFYETTRIGRLVAARHDLPTYHHLPEARQRAALLTTTELMAQRLKTVQHLIGGLLVLCAISMMIWLF